jgi:alkylation response protein AidB-like acyl-CoA dehydrogenase
MATGEWASWQLLTEPHGGSDLASTKTTAIRDGDEYVLNGTKTFVGSTDTKPDWLWTITMTDPQGPRHQNLSWFVIPAELPGIVIQPIDLLNGGGGHKCSVFFEDVRVPAFNLIGGENNGWKVASTHLELEHGGGGTVRGNRQVERFLDYVKEAAINGQSIASDPDVRDLLGELISEDNVSTLFGLRNFWMSRTKKKMSYEGSQSSYFRKMGGLRKSRAMQQAIGYYAIMSDKQLAPANGWVDSFMKTSIISVHPGGTQDIQRVIMARRMGLGRTVQEAAGQLPD